MDNAREITPRKKGEEGQFLELVEQTKAYFLREIIEEFSEAQGKYDLNEEFAKTKRNRSFIVLGSVLGVVAIFVSFAIILNSYLEESQNKFTILSSEFDDISLRDLLESAKNVEAQLQQSRVDLVSIETARDLELARARTDIQNQMAMMRSRNPGAEEIERRMAELDRQLLLLQGRINASYEEKLQTAHEAIAEFESQLATFDPDKLALARQQEVIINNERQLYDLERSRLSGSYEERIKNITDEYESRISRQEQFAKQLEQSFNNTLDREVTRLTTLYNPRYADERSAALFARPINQDRLTRTSIVVPRDYVRENLVTQEEADTLSRSLVEYNELIALLNKVPYEGSVPEIIQQLQFRMFDGLDTGIRPYARFWDSIVKLRADLAARTDELKNASQEKDTLKAELDTAKAYGEGMMSALASYAAAADVDSLIVDSTDSEKLLLYVKQENMFAPNQRALVIRWEAPPGSVGASRTQAGIASNPLGQIRVQVAEIEITETGLLTYARLVQSSFGKTIKAYDAVIEKP